MILNPFAMKEEAIEEIEEDIKKHQSEPSEISVKSNEAVNDISDKVIDNANKYFLVKILSPEVSKNEEKKRMHKDQLINIVKIFLIAQFVIVTFLLFGIFIMYFVFHGLGKEIQLDYLKEIIKFATVYITSVVAELIAMLRYIVTNVFDTSITGLVEFYKDANARENSAAKSEYQEKH